MIFRRMVSGTSKNGFFSVLNTLFISLHLFIVPFNRSLFSTPYVLLWEAVEKAIAMLFILIRNNHIFLQGRAFNVFIALSE
jgi:hypothetical protein